MDLDINFDALVFFYNVNLFKNHNLPDLFSELREPMNQAKVDGY